MHLVEFEPQMPVFEQAEIFRGFYRAATVHTVSFMHVFICICRHLAGVNNFPPNKKGNF
jgi:hypothetical protein